MRIYTKPFDAVREVERDLWEMGINVHPQTMQDKVVAKDEDYCTKELQSYVFQIVDHEWNIAQETQVIDYLIPEHHRTAVKQYIAAEHADRLGPAQNPGNSWKERKEVWDEFMHDGKFAYTYSERIAPQLTRIIVELSERPETRQAIINIHSNISPIRIPFDRTPHSPQVYEDLPAVIGSDDLRSMGGRSRVPCSLYYQFLRRNGKLNMVYAMRSCDFLTHFPVDIMLAMRMQQYIADTLQAKVGVFTYFTGSLHAYRKDMKVRGIF